MRSNGSKTLSYPQAAHLLEAPKSSGDDIASISSACFKLNSMQLRVLLEHYVPGQGEPHIPQELIESVVGVAESTADELTRSDGRQVQLKEEPHLQLPFLLPEDGYSCDIVRGVPSGLADFLDPLCKTGECDVGVCVHVCVVEVPKSLRDMLKSRWHARWRLGQFDLLHLKRKKNEKCS